MYYGQIFESDIANGKGCRTSLFVSGCTHHCKGCFNQNTWNFKYGQPYTQETEDMLMESLKPDYIQGLSLLGGEPFEPENQPFIRKLVERIKAELPNKDIWAYSGYLIEELLSSDSRCHTDDTRYILDCIDVLVDGEFHLEEKDISLAFRGSRNQRVIDVRKSLTGNDIVLLDV